MSSFKTPGQEMEKVSDLILLKGLWPFIKPYSMLLFISVLLIFAITGMDLLLPYLTQKAIDGFILSKETIKSAAIFGYEISTYLGLALFFASVVVTTFVLDFFQSLFMEFTSQKIILNIRNKVYEHMICLSVSFYDANTSGRLVSRVTNDIENMNEMFSSILIFLFKDMLMMISIVLIMFLFDFKFALATVVIVPMVITAVIFFSKISRHAFRVMREKIAEINHSFSENIAGISIIETTGSGKHINKKFKKLNLDHFKAGMLQIKAFAFFMPLIEFFNVLSFVIIIFYGSIRIYSGDVSVGVLVAFISYMKMFFRPVRELAEKFNLLQKAFASSERIVKILNIDKDIDETDQNKSLDKIDSIEFLDIDFSYKKNIRVLKDISFKINKGESLGIVGHTGAGKSSIINLISGFYKPDSGRILVNDLDYDQYLRRDIRDKTALVMQDPILFSATLRDNLILGRKGMKEEELIEALKNANCDFIFNKANQGLDTIISEGGRPFSSGEKQLICIARAFAFNPDFIIFDEATSYIDSESEKNVHLAMKNLMKNRTSLMIAHRLSTVRDANKIIVMKDGRICEMGDHESLLKLKGEYYNLIEHEKLGLK